jgi:hypothetical protein
MPKNNINQKTATDILKLKWLVEKKISASDKFQSKPLRVYRDNAFVNIYKSEAIYADQNKNFYVEVYTPKYFEDDSLVIPAHERILYKLPKNITSYPQSNINEELYEVPVSDLIAVFSVNPDVQQTLIENLLDDEFKDELLSKMTMRDFFAILHKEPISNKSWLNDLIFVSLKNKK